MFVCNVFPKFKVVEFPITPIVSRICNTSKLSEAFSNRYHVVNASNVFCCLIAIEILEAAVAAHRKQARIGAQTEFAAPTAPLGTNKDCCRMLTNRRSYPNVRFSLQKWRREMCNERRVIGAAAQSPAGRPQLRGQQFEGVSRGSVDQEPHPHGQNRLQIQHLNECSGCHVLPSLGQCAGDRA